MAIDAKGVLSNLKNYGLWEYSSYKLRKEEADALIKVLEEKSQLVILQSDDARIVEGDVVVAEHENALEKMIVTHVNYKQNRVTCMSSRGLFFPFPIERLKKTGESYPQLLQIINKLGEG